MTATIIETTTFSDVRVGDTIQIVDDGRTVAATILEKGDPRVGSTLLPIAIQINLLRYAYDRDKSDEVIVLSRAKAAASSSPSKND